MLGELADGTGGTFFHNDNGLKEGLNRLAARPEYIYVLGFLAAGPEVRRQLSRAEGQSRESRATPRCRCARVTGRRSHAVDPAEQAKDEIRDAVFSQRRNPGHSVGRADRVFPADAIDAKTELTVTAHLDARRLAVSKGGGPEQRHRDRGGGAFRREWQLHFGDRAGSGTASSRPDAGGVAEFPNHFQRNFQRGAGLATSCGWWSGTRKARTMAARNRGVEIP